MSLVRFKIYLKYCCFQITIHACAPAFKFNSFLIRETVSHHPPHPSMDFEDYLQSNVHSLLSRHPFDFFAKSFVPYKQLKIALSKIDPASSIESTLIKGSGQCCICLENFERWSEMAFTKCNHAFHPACLAGYLEGDWRNTARTCPLCRSPEQDLHPFGQDGLVVDFLLTFWERVKAVENCHAKFMKIAQSRQRTLLQSHAGLSVLAKLFGSRRQRALRREAEALLLELDAADFVALANLAGFLRLLEELQERCMEPGPSAACRERLLACRFVVDSAPAARPGLDSPLAQALVEVAPAGRNHVLFANSGSEANDAAVKLGWGGPVWGGGGAWGGGGTEGQGGLGVGCE